MVTVIGSNGVTIGSSVIVLNPDGTVRSETSASGVCTTYEYTGPDGFVPEPVAIRRSSTQCGVLPINRNSDEVEIRTYVKGEPDRLSSITRLKNGVTELIYAGFTYDRDRRLTSATTQDSASPFTFSYADVLPLGAEAPGGPVPGGWKTELLADPLGRPSSLARFIDPTNRQTYQYTFAASSSPRPSAVLRGHNGIFTSVAMFAYDDFDRIIEATVPEAGRPGVLTPTRFEYDVAGRQTKQRVGIGSPDVSTTSYSYDSLSRLRLVDHDLEHPVRCADQQTPAGTPIQDAEFIYDTCPVGDTPPGFTCSNGLGRLVISRAILQCGDAHDVVKKGRWYAYDSAGRIAQIAFATVTGEVIGVPAVMRYDHDAADRVVSQVSPLNAAFGTSYTYAASSGRVSTVATTATPPVLIASALAYQAFGSLVGYTGASVQVVEGGTRTLVVKNQFREDDALVGMIRRFQSDGTAANLDVVAQALSYTPAGQLQRREDAADPANSRFYAYDSLQRLTCEVLDGTAADCAMRSSNLLGLLDYGNGRQRTDVDIPGRRSGFGISGRPRRAGVYELVTRGISVQQRLITGSGNRERGSPVHSRP